MEVGHGYCGTKCNNPCFCQCELHIARNENKQGGQAKHAFTAGAEAYWIQLPMHLESGITKVFRSLGAFSDGDMLTITAQPCRQILVGQELKSQEQPSRPW